MFLTTFSQTVNIHASIKENTLQEDSRPGTPLPTESKLESLAKYDVVLEL